MIIGRYQDWGDGNGLRPCKERADVIKEKLKKLKLKNVSLLDFGGAEGYFCHALQDMCREMVLVDDIWNRSSDFDKIEIIRLKLGVEDVGRLMERKFDVVLLLSVIHHFDKYKEAFNHFLKCKHLFVETPNEGEGKNVINSHLAKEINEYILKNPHELLIKTEAVYDKNVKRNLYYIKGNL